MRQTAAALMTAGIWTLLFVMPIGAKAQPPPAAAGGQATFPAQQRPPGDPEVIARGRAVYDISCRSCHGADLRGGDLGGPNLLRSQLVLNDREGELMIPVMRDGVSRAGVPSMPPQSVTESDARAVAEFIHSVTARAQRQGAPPAGPPVELNVLVGDSAAGERYFAAHCAMCHSPDQDLQGIGARIPDAKELQNTWVRGGGGGRDADRPSVTVTVTGPGVERVVGQLERLDDFIVVLTTTDGHRRSFSRRGGVPQVEISDPLERHRELLAVYTDTNIHDVTAYLATLK